MGKPSRAGLGCFLVLMSSLLMHGLCVCKAAVERSHMHFIPTATGGGALLSVHPVRHCSHSSESRQQPVSEESWTPRTQLCALLFLTEVMTTGVVLSSLPFRRSGLWSGWHASTCRRAAPHCCSRKGTSAAPTSYGSRMTWWVCPVSGQDGPESCPLL